MNEIKANIRKLLMVVVVSTGMAWSGLANALPIFQVHALGSEAVDGTILPEGLDDDDTWLITGDSFTLELIAAFKWANMSITNAYLVITTADDALNADLGSLSGATRYEDSGDFETAIGASFNGHSPYGGADDKVDVFAYSINPDFMNIHTGLKDCNADVAGTTDCADAPTKEGEIRELDVSGLNLDWIHFDLVGYVTKEHNGNTREFWDISPGSHDSTGKVPEPAVIGLFALGLLGLGFARRRKA